MGVVKKIRSRLQGFTLIELLIVIGIIAVLAAATFVALNPLTRFQDARDARRRTDISAVLSASAREVSLVHSLLVMFSCC